MLLEVLVIHGQLSSVFNALSHLSSCGSRLKSLGVIRNRFSNPSDTEQRKNENLTYVAPHRVITDYFTPQLNYHLSQARL